MSMLAWNDRLSVNIKEIDDQHKKLVDMVNQLHAALKEGKGDAAALKLVDEMKKYAASHFALEEKHMKGHNYPEYLAHKAEHDKFVGKVLEVEKDCKSGKCAISMEILNFLSSWLVTHIKGTDKKYGPYLNERGVK